MTQTVLHLYERPEHRRLVADWIYEAFWFELEGYSPAFFEGKLSEAAGPDRLPLSLLALEGDRPVGTVNLIVNDDPTRPHLTPWLAALYVEPDCRGRGHAVALCRRLFVEAGRLGCHEVYIATHIPDFYNRFGAEIHEQAAADFWVLHVALPVAA